MDLTHFHPLSKLPMFIEITNKQIEKIVHSSSWCIDVNHAQHTGNIKAYFVQVS